MTSPTERDNLLASLTRAAKGLAAGIEQLDRDYPLAAPPLRKAAARLLERQFITGDNQHERGYYEAVKQQSALYSALVRALGRRLEVEPQHGYAGLAIDRGMLVGPRQYGHLAATVLIQLAQLYEGAFERMELTCEEPAGEARLELTDAISHFSAAAHLAAPSRSAYAATIQELAKLGICELGTSAAGIDYIRIRPTIRTIVTSAFLADCEQALAAHERAAVVNELREVAHG